MTLKPCWTLCLALFLTLAACTDYSDDDQNPDTQNSALVDSDNDGLSDEEEERLGTDPQNADTDADGINDGDEIANGSDPLEASQESPENPTNPAIPHGETQCSTDSDCPMGTLCEPLSGLCEEEGDPDDEPTDPTIPDGETPCNADSDCPMGTFCEPLSGLCEEEGDPDEPTEPVACSNDADCPSALLCDVDTGTCIRDNTPGCIDNDGDGFCPEMGDCDDNDPAIHPYGDEILDDDLDNDCDGVIDEEEGSYCRVDSDCQADEFCDVNRFECSPADPGACIEDSQCAPNQYCAHGSCIDEVDPNACVDNDGDGFCAEQGDCDDGDQLISPASQEVLGDGVDNDCDGEVDES